MEKTAKTIENYFSKYIRALSTISPCSDVHWVFLVEITLVLDLVNQVHDVVLVMCIFSSGKPQGVGILERGEYGEGDGNGEISLRATWDRGGQDPITARRVPSK
jgi:hypothetical protein